MRTRAHWLLPAVLLLLAACTAGRKGPQVEPIVFITVRNDLIPPTALTVRIAATVGARQILGSVSPGASRSFRFRPALPSGEFRLIAETASTGREIVSRPFSLAQGDQVVWSVRNNMVDYQEP